MADKRKQKWRKAQMAAQQAAYRAYVKELKKYWQDVGVDEEDMKTLMQASGSCLGTFGTMATAGTIGTAPCVNTAGTLGTFWCNGCLGPGDDDPKEPEPEEPEPEEPEPEEPEPETPKD